MVLTLWTFRPSSCSWVMSCLSKGQKVRLGSFPKVNDMTSSHDSLFAELRDFINWKGVKGNRCYIVMGNWENDEMLFTLNSLAIEDSKPAGMPSLYYITSPPLPKSTQRMFSLLLWIPASINGSLPNSCISFVYFSIAPAFQLPLPLRRSISQPN